MVYETNFHKGTSGNVLSIGEDLTITRDEKCWYVIGRLFKIDDNGHPKLIQIEQTGSRQNPHPNSITFEMKQRENGETVPLPIGNYFVSCYVSFKPDAKKGRGSRFGDQFEIE